MLEIAVPAPVRRSFHYLAPPGAKPAPGIRCRVPFGNRTVVGLLLAVAPNPAIDPARLKPVNDLIDEAAVLPPSILALCRWAADYYHYPVGEAFSHALPALLRQGGSSKGEEERLFATSTNAEKLTRAPRQAALFQLLQQHPEGLSRTDLAGMDFSSAVVRELIGKNLASWRSHQPASLPFDPGSVLKTDSLPELSTEQSHAVRTIQQGESSTTLMFGVTGSGKTEVYLRTIEQVLRQGRQALVLVPEIGLTPQTIKRFSDRFNVPVAVLHSGLTDRERMDGWRRAGNGEAGIVIGTRSAIFTPLKLPGVIVVDEEHDSSYKQQDGFRYNARDLAVYRARLEQIPVILASATPSLESWHNARQDRYQLVRLTERPGGAAAPRFQVLDLHRSAVIDGFTQPLIQAIRDRLQRNEQVLVFLNRRGYSPVLLCPACGWLAECSRCDARMTLHRSNHALICHHCGATARIPAVCPGCDGDELLPIGEGTQRLETALNQMFPDYPVIRIDRDSTRRRDAMTDFVNEIATGKPMILVGTQMLAKGHHFPNVTLVVIKEMDASFYSANFRAAERTAQLILQVGGRAGRAEKPGVVAIETNIPDQPIFRQLIDNGYELFADEILQERLRHMMPPFSHHALIRAEAVGKQTAIAFLESVADQLEPHPSVDVLGPIPASMERRAGRYRGQLLFTSGQRRELHQHLSLAISKAESGKLARQVRWSVDVDPIDLF